MRGRGITILTPADLSLGTGTARAWSELTRLLLGRILDLLDRPRHDDGTNSACDGDDLGLALARPTSLIGSSSDQHRTNH